jgi:hypothetical protein
MHSARAKQLWESGNFVAGRRTHIFPLRSPQSWETFKAEEPTSMGWGQTVVLVLGFEFLDSDQQTYVYSVSS